MNRLRRTSVAALVEGSRAPLASIEWDARESIHLPIRVGDEVAGALELRRTSRPFDEDERTLGAEEQTLGAGEQAPRADESASPADEQAPPADA